MLFSYRKFIQFPVFIWSLISFLLPGINYVQKLSTIWILLTSLTHMVNHENQITGYLNSFWKICTEELVPWTCSGEDISFWQFQSPILTWFYNGGMVRSPWTESFDQEEHIKMIEGSYKRDITFSRQNIWRSGEDMILTEFSEAFLQLS